MGLKVSPYGQVLSGRKTRVPQARATLLSNGKCTVTYYNEQGEVVATQFDKKIDMDYQPTHLTYYKKDYALVVTRSTKETL